MQLHTSELQLSFQSVNSHPSAPSKISNFSVVKRISSYITVAAALACACQGPRPPSLASFLVRQMPSSSANSSIYLRIRKTHKLPDSFCLHSWIQTNTSASPQKQWLRDVNAHPAHIDDRHQHLVVESNERSRRSTTALSRADSRPLKMISPKRRLRPS